MIHLCCSWNVVDVNLPSYLHFIIWWYYSKSPFLGSVLMHGWLSLHINCTVKEMLIKHRSDFACMELPTDHRVRFVGGKYRWNSSEVSGRHASLGLLCLSHLWGCSPYPIGRTLLVRRYMMINSEYVVGVVSLCLSASVCLCMSFSFYCVICGRMGWAF